MGSDGGKTRFAERSFLRELEGKVFEEDRRVRGVWIPRPAKGNGRPVQDAESIPRTALLRQKRSVP